MTDTDSYIALRRTADGCEATLVPAGVSTRDRYDHQTRTIRSMSELDTLRCEWGVDDVRGDGVDHLEEAAESTSGASPSPRVVT